MPRHYQLGGRSSEGSFWGGVNDRISERKRREVLVAREDVSFEARSAARALRRANFFTSPAVNFRVF